MHRLLRPATLPRSPTALLGRYAMSTVAHPRGRLVVIGSGWGAFSLLRSVSRKDYEVVVVSPRNHFLFTPLLASSAVGTLEFRCITEPIRQLRDLSFHQAVCDAIDLDKKQLSLTTALEDNNTRFTLSYDTLVIACGAVSNTFGIPGVAEHAFFLKQISDARRIRQRIVECFEFASEPGTSKEEIDSILSFVVVGAGPTGVEFSGELYDLVTSDIGRLYPNLKNSVRITLVEASNKILSSFDESLSEFASSRFARQGIVIEKGVSVSEVKAKKVILRDGREIDYGLLVWSTGVGTTELVKSLPLKKEANRIVTDPQLRVFKGDTTLPGVYALGDCATIEQERNPATAQMAQQKGYYLAQALNRLAKGDDPKDLSPFKFRPLGTLAYIGGWKALFDSKVKVSGRAAWLIWRSAYFTMTVSMKNKILIPMYWFLTWIFGRDTTRF